MERRQRSLHRFEYARTERQKQRMRWAVESARAVISAVAESQSDARVSQSKQPVRVLVVGAKRSIETPTTNEREINPQRAATEQQT